MASASRREGFGMGVAEALVMGKPVVALANAGARQQQHAAGERLTITEPDVSTFADALGATLDRSAGRPSVVQTDLADVGAARWWGSTPTNCATCCRESSTTVDAARCRPIRAGDAASTSP